MDTVKALFVRSFPRRLSMGWFEHPCRKIYILDRLSNTYYELDDLRWVGVWGVLCGVGCFMGSGVVYGEWGCLIGLWGWGVCL